MGHSEDMGAFTSNWNQICSEFTAYFFKFGKKQRTQKKTHADTGRINNFAQTERETKKTITFCCEATVLTPEPPC